jgi:hypothetical protein
VELAHTGDVATGQLDRLATKPVVLAVAGVLVVWGLAVLRPVNAGSKRRAPTDPTAPDDDAPDV